MKHPLRRMFATLAIVTLLFGAAPLPDALAKSIKAPPSREVNTKPFPFQSTEAHFDAIFPAGFPTPTEQVNRHAGSNSKQKLVQLTTAQDDETVILIWVSDYEAITEAPEKLLSHALEASLEGISAKEDSRKLLTEGPFIHQMTYFHAQDGQTPKESYGRVDQYLDAANKRLFQVLFLTFKKGETQGPAITDFFNSFKPQS